MAEICIPVAEVAQRLGVTIADVLDAVQDGRARVTIDPKPVVLEAITKRH